MNFLNRLLGRQPQISGKASATSGAATAYYLGRPIYAWSNYEAVAEHSYIANAYGFFCIRMIAQAVSSVPLMVFDGDEELTDHPLLALLNRPNPMTGYQKFMEASCSYFLLAGSMYLEQVGPDGRPPLEIYSHRPDRFGVVLGADGFPEAYEYRVNGQLLRFPVDPLTGDSPILHISAFHPLNDFHGMARSEPAKRPITQINEVNDFSTALMQNRATPSGMIVFPPVTNMAGMSEKVPEEVLDSVEKSIVDRHTGVANAGRPIMVGGEAKWVPLSINPKDLDSTEAKRSAARETCLIYGVPPVLALDEGNTYSNLAEAKTELWLNTVLPLLNQIVGDLNTGLSPRFGENIEIRPDLDGVPALEPVRVARRKSVTDLVEQGIIDENEGRHMLQYGDRDDGFVAKFEPAALSALLKISESYGPEPLFRYMRSKGLVSKSTTAEKLSRDALKLIEDTSENDDPEDETDDQDREA